MKEYSRDMGVEEETGGEKTAARIMPAAVWKEFVECTLECQVSFVAFSYSRIHRLIVERWTARCRASWLCNTIAGQTLPQPR